MVRNLNNGRPVFANATGAFSVPAIDIGLTTIAPDPLLYYAPNPASHTESFSILEQQVDSPNDFAMQPTGTFNDLQVYLSPMGDFRPGFQQHYVIDYRNIGTTVLTPELKFYTNPWLLFDSATVVPSWISADSMSWQLPALIPFGEGRIIVYSTMDVNAPLGDPLPASACIEPVAGDATPNDNIASWDMEVVGAFDPNDILVDRSTIDLAELTPTPPELQYLIRFQNVGNASAVNVRVENDIPYNADLSTFRFVSSSHPVQVDYVPYVDRFHFTFENINLPHDYANEPASHGFVRYAIRPRSTSLLGDSVLNHAAILFDFNAPVITNTAVTLVDNTTQVSLLEGGHMLISPNPSHGTVQLDLPAPVSNGDLTVTDMLGREVYRDGVTGIRHLFYLDALLRGVYLIGLSSGKHTWREKLVLN